MKNQWITFFSGYVQMEIKGKGIERFLNECVRQGVYLWEVKRIEEKITCHVLVKDLRVVRRVRREHECSITFKRRSGIPFQFKRLMTNSGFFLGMIAFLVVLFMLSNMVWSINIKGASPETSELIQKELVKMGVKVGAVQFKLDDEETIQRKLTNGIPSITWVGVQLNGTTFDFQVVEKTDPKKEEKLVPRNLVATKKAVITNMFVEAGKPVVQVNQLVKAGDVLVTGKIGTEENFVLIPAKGNVFGETWDVSTIDVPLQSTFDVYTGEEKRSHYVSLGSWKIKVWGFGENKFKTFKTDVTVHPFQFLRWDLPIQYEKDVSHEEEKGTREYTVEEAVNVGKEMARKELDAKMDKFAKVKEEKVLRQSVENGKVKLTILFRIIENIAVPQSILQGD